MPSVVVAMSGGVDSSVAAALLVSQGYSVTGIMMRLWSEPGCEADNRCCTPDAMAQARRVAGILAIPFYVLDAQEIFRQTVVQDFINGYANGKTPNPCLVCNRIIRWNFLLHHALATGAQYLATGHYVRLRQDPTQGFQILRGYDERKDQSYVLHMLNQEQLSHALFPLGGLTKPQVRQLAAEYKLPVAERPDSQDLCFLGDQEYRQFLLRHVPQISQPGPILTSRRQPIGQHKGLAFYTIGQRKGLGIASPTPLYVLAKNLESNSLIVGPADELGQSQLSAMQVNWISGRAPQEQFRAQVKIRYKAMPAWAEVTPQPAGEFLVHFDSPQRDITSGQAAVFYSQDICLGGGVIK